MLTPKVAIKGIDELLERLSRISGAMEKEIHAAIKGQADELRLAIRQARKNNVASKKTSAGLTLQKRNGSPFLSPGKNGTQPSHHPRRSPAKTRWHSGSGDMLADAKQKAKGAIFKARKNDTSSSQKRPLVRPGKAAPLYGQRDAEVQAHLHKWVLKLPEGSFLRSALRELEPSIKTRLNEAIERAVSI